MAAKNKPHTKEIKLRLLYLDDNKRLPLNT